MEESESTRQRHIAERRFHDEKYSGTELYPRHYGVHPTYQVFQRMKAACGPLAGKSVLELGCGEGWTTYEIAAMGARVDAFDISGEAVERARVFLDRKGVSAVCDIREMSAERLDYPADRYDVVVGFAILHHLDLGLSMPEIHRVMKPGALACFAEPLGGNPLINLYRKLTPKYRTPDERPIRISELRRHLSGFREFRHQECYFVAMAALALVYVPLARRLYPVANRLLGRVDDLVLRVLPLLGRWAWYSIFTWRK